MECSLKKYFVIYIFSFVSSLIFSLISLLDMNNCDEYFGCFGAVSLFSIYLVLWCFLGCVGYFIASVFFKLRGIITKPTKEQHATLGLVIGISNFVVFLHIEHLLILLWVPISLSFLYSLVLFSSIAGKGE